MATYTTAQTQSDLIFEREFFPLADAVFTFAVRLTNDRSRAADLLQETYLKAWRAVTRGRYTEGTNAKAWLFRICRNAFINEYRIGIRRPCTVPLEAAQLSGGISAQTPAVHEEVESYQMGDEVTTAINALRPEFKVVLLLDLEEFSYEEIAEIVKVPIGTVRSRLHRARKQLEKALLDYAAQQGYNRQDSGSADGIGTAPNQG